MSSEAVAGNDNLDAETLRSGFSGTIILPGDEGYEAARVVMYGGHDKRPAMIARRVSTVRRPLV